MVARASSARPASSSRRASVNQAGATAGGVGAWARAGPASASRRRLLVRAIRQPMLAQVVREVPGIDPEKAGRFLAHAPAPLLGLQQHLLLQAEEGRAQVQLARGGGRVPRRGGGGRGEQVQVVEAVGGVED